MKRRTFHGAVAASHVFFTHLHYDHCMDDGRLVYGPDIRQLTFSAPTFTKTEGY